MGILFGWKAFVAAILGVGGRSWGHSRRFPPGVHRDLRRHDFPLDAARPDRLLDHPADLGVSSPWLLRGAVQRAVEAMTSRVPLLGWFFGALAAVALERVAGTPLAQLLGLQKIPVLFGLSAMIRIPS